jgi:hypothetical protein
MIQLAIGARIAVALAAEPPYCRPVCPGVATEANLRIRFTLLAVLTAAILIAPPAAEAQPAGKVWRIGASHVGRDHVPPSASAKTSRRWVTKREGICDSPFETSRTRKDRQSVGD